MSWLVVNADDAGFARGTDDAILRCAGVVRSASVVVNGATGEEFVPRARDAGLDLGLHVNLTQGRALAGPHRTLTDAGGRFPGKTELWARAARLDPEEVCREVLAQWERLLEWGAGPTHLDGHNHVHVLPPVRAALAGLPPSLWVRAPVDREPPPPPFPEEFEAWARAEGPWRRTDAFTGYAFARSPSLEALTGGLVPGARTTELMVHPGARPGSPFTSSPDRERESAILTSPELKLEIARRGLTLASFAELPCA